MMLLLLIFGDCRDLDNDESEDDESINKDGRIPAKSPYDTERITKLIEGTKNVSFFVCVKNKNIDGLCLGCITIGIVLPSNKIGKPRIINHTEKSIPEGTLLT